MNMVRGTAFCLLIVGAAVLGAAFAQVPEPQHSRISTPVRPQGTDPAFAEPSKAQLVIPGVPKYLWRHGCGPTAVGMVVGYWDGLGLNLISGDASSETAAVRQAIASGGDCVLTNPIQDLPWAAGNEHHYEDYARPIDMRAPILTDAYITAGRAPHADDCIADYAGTSRSPDLAYGWSWSGGIEPGFVDYVSSQSANYEATSTTYYFDYAPTLTYAVLKNEIDHQRPMVLLVDSDRDGITDHFVTAVGYDDSNQSSPQYLFYDTWDRNVHAAGFRAMSTSYAWGVWAGWSFNIVDNTRAMSFVDLPHGGSFAADDSLSWTVSVSDQLGMVSYQWQYGLTQETMADLPGETSATFSIDHLGAADAGWYRCRAEDARGEPIYTPAVYVEVWDQVPVAGVAALVGLGMLVAGFAVRTIRRRR